MASEGGKGKTPKQNAPKTVLGTWGLRERRRTAPISILSGGGPGNCDEGDKRRRSRPKRWSTHLWAPANPVSATRALMAVSATRALMAVSATHALMAVSATHALMAVSATHALMANPVSATHALVATPLTPRAPGRW